MLDNYQDRKVSYYLFEDIYKLDDEKRQKIGVNFKNTNYTYKEIEHSVNCYCHILAAKGVKPGDHVALLGMNSYNWLIAFYAIIKVGAVAVLLNYMARHETLVELIKFTDSKFLALGKFTALSKNENELDLLLFAEPQNLARRHNSKQSELLVMFFLCRLLSRFSVFFNFVIFNSFFLIFKNKVINELNL